MKWMMFGRHTYDSVMSVCSYFRLFLYRTCACHLLMRNTAYLHGFKEVA